MNREEVEQGGSGGEVEEWTFESARRWQRTIASQATPEQRVAWLEEMIALAHSRGAVKVGSNPGSEGSTGE